MAKGMHKPASLAKRIELFFNSGLTGKPGFRKPGSNKK